MQINFLSYFINNLILIDKILNRRFKLSNELQSAYLAIIATSKQGYLYETHYCSYKAL